MDTNINNLKEGQSIWYCGKEYIFVEYTMGHIRHTKGIITRYNWSKISTKPPVNKKQLKLWKIVLGGI